MAMAMTIAGGAFSAFGILREGQIAEMQGKFEKTLALRNQQALERQAKAEIKAAALEEGRVGRKEKIVKAAQRAVSGKTGVGLAGATLSVLADTAYQFSLEKNLVLRRGLLRSRELIEKGYIIAAQGRWARTLGKEARKLSYIRAGAALFGAGASSGIFGGQRPGTTGGQDSILADQSNWMMGANWAGGYPMT